MDSLLSLRKEIESITAECDCAIKLNFKLDEENAKLQSALEIAVKYLEKIDEHFGTDYCSGDTMIAHEALEEIKKATNG